MLESLRVWLLGGPAYRFDFAQAKRRCRVLLIDDDPNALPLTDITSDDYNISQRTAVDPDLLRQCESGVYDIIILDYNGIAPAAITPEDGFGIFDRIRKANPEQYIIAVSAQTYDISRTAYFKNANDWLKKPTELATTKDKIDTGIRFLFDKNSVLERLRTQMLSDGFRQKSIERVMQRLAEKNYADLDEMNEMIKRVAKVSDISKTILGTLKTLAKISAG